MNKRPRKIIYYSATILFMAGWGMAIWILRRNIAGTLITNLSAILAAFIGTVLLSEWVETGKWPTLLNLFRSIFGK